MAADVDSVGARIEQILGELERIADPGVRERGEELVHALLEFYGSGLGRLVQLLGEQEGGEQVLDALSHDPIVTGLLVLHDLHPHGTMERVRAALEQVRPYLGTHAGDVELLGITEDGVVRLQLEGSCDGCPSSAVTAKHAIERAVRDAAPEVSDVQVLGVVAEATGPGGRTLLPVQVLECPVPEPAR